MDEKTEAFDKLEHTIKAYCESLRNDKQFQAYKAIVIERNIDDEIGEVVDAILGAVENTMKHGGDLRDKITKILKQS